MLKVVNFFIVAFPKYREKLLAIYTPSFARSRTNGPPNTAITKDFAPRLLALIRKIQTQFLVLFVPLSTTHFIFSPVIETSQIYFKIRRKSL